jgi:hypothetical protein
MLLPCTAIRPLLGGCADGAGEAHADHEDRSIGSAACVPMPLPPARRQPPDD